jgi:hypothetical protein
MLKAAPVEWPEGSTERPSYQQRRQTDICKKRLIQTEIGFKGVNNVWTQPSPLAIEADKVHKTYQIGFGSFFLLFRSISGRRKYLFLAVSVKPI